MGVGSSRASEPRAVSREAFSRTAEKKKARSVTFAVKGLAPSRRLRSWHIRRAPPREPTVGSEAPLRASSYAKVDTRFRRDSTRTYPVTNDHPELHVDDHEAETTFQADVLARWLVMLPQPAVKHFQLEPNFNDGEGDKELWVGRLWQFRRILWLQYRQARTFSVHLTDLTKAELAAHYAVGTAAHAALLRLQRWCRGWFTRFRSMPSFLDELVGKNIRSIAIFMHGSGGLVWGNVRFCRILAGFGCVVFMPDHMASSEGRARHLAELHTRGVTTDYWENNLFYRGKKAATGESLDFSTTVEGVLTRPEYYKELYEKVFRARSAELHYLLRRLSATAQVLGVTLMGTSEGAMSVSRFDDKPYGKLITARIISAYACEYCYFTPTRAAADLGGQLDVPTLNLIGTRDEFFGPPADGADWPGSIAAHIAADTSTGWGETPTGNAYEAFLRQGLTTGLVATFVGAEHDGTLAADNAIRDVLYSFLSSPLRCTELMEQWRETEYLKMNAVVKRRCVSSPALVSADGDGGEQIDILEGSSLLWVEIHQNHGIANAVPYGVYKMRARRWGREQARETGDKFFGVVRTQVSVDHRQSVDVRASSPSMHSADEPTALPAADSAYGGPHSARGTTISAATDRISRLEHEASRPVVVVHSASNGARPAGAWAPPPPPRTPSQVAGHI